MVDHSEIQPNEIGRVLAETREALAGLRRPGPEDGVEGADGADAADDELRGEGEAAEGRVRVTVLPNGRVETIDIDHRVIREGSEEVAEQTCVAVNAAVKDLRLKLLDRVVSSGSPRADTTEKLMKAQESSLKAMGAMFDSLQGTMDKIARAAGTNGV